MTEHTFERLAGRYANIRSNQTKGVVSLVLEFPMTDDSAILRMVGGRLPDADNPVHIAVARVVGMAD